MKSFQTDGYRSKFEKNFRARLIELKLKAEYEVDKIPYTEPESTHTYYPDWKIGPGTYIETKGRFTVWDRKKLLWVRECNPEVKVYLLFQNAEVRLTKSSKTTYRMWCERNGFECADINEENTWRKWFN